MCRRYCSHLKKSNAWEAAMREIREELGMTPDLTWVLPSVNCF